MVSRSNSRSKFRVTIASRSSVQAVAARYIKAGECADVVGTLSGLYSLAWGILISP